MKTKTLATRRTKDDLNRETGLERAEPFPVALVPLPPGESLLTEREAAALLSLSTATLKKWRRIRREPRYYRLGSAIRYRREDLEAFVSGSAANPRFPRHDEKGDG